MSFSVTAKQSPVSKLQQFSFYEFFAGGGMARAGLGARWECLFANDFDTKKATAYKANWGEKELEVDSVERISVAKLPGEADLAWASFPCQDLSLAGAQAGLAGKRSGTFWSFWKLMSRLKEEQRNPRMLVLENVYGLVTSNRGQDFRALLDTLRHSHYRVGALVIDAVHFVPQSRPRLFVVAVRDDLNIPRKLQLGEPLAHWTPGGLSTVLKDWDFFSRPDWISWRLPHPPQRRQVFADVIDDEPEGVPWHTATETQHLLAMMSRVNRDKVRQAQLAGRNVVGTLYRRTRVDPDGVRRQRAEVRFDDVAGCLRTPGGGSSRQTILVVEGKRVRSRLLSPRESARLMGLPEGYVLPEKYNEAYHLTGDGVVVPVVRHLAEYILEPVLKAQKLQRESAA